MSIKTNHSKESLKPESGVLKIDSSGALALPTGDTAGRPAISAAGYVRFQTEDTVLEYNDGAHWQTITDKEYVDTKVSSLSGKVDALNLDSLTDVIVTNPTDGQVISFDSALGLFKPQTQTFNAITKLFSGDGTKLTFDLQTTVYSVNNMVVTINGVSQEPFYSFNLIDGHIIAFDEAPELNDRIQVRILKSTITSDRPRPNILDIYYGTVTNYATITIVASDISYGTTVKIGGRSVSRIDYMSTDRMQIMIDLSLMTDSFWNSSQDLTIVDTSGNEFVFPKLIRYPGSNPTPSWKDSTSYIGTFSSGNSINFPIRVNNATSITIGPAYDGEHPVTWLSISSTNLVGTAPTNSSPSRYEIKITATNGGVSITKNYWLLVI